MAAKPLLAERKFDSGLRSDRSRGDSRFESVLRSLRLQLFPQFTRWKDKHEHRKTAIYHSRRAATLHALLHVVPLFAATTLVVFNIIGQRIGDVSADSLAAIQFAAKILEVMLQASISAILLGLIRYKALGPIPLPLGSIVAPYQTNETSYLWSLELWGSLSSSCMDVSTRILLVVAIPMAVILAALVGPSNAILMIPRLGNYPEGGYLNFLNETDATFPDSINLVNQQLQYEQDYNTSLRQIVSGHGGSKTSIVVTDVSDVRVASTYFYPNNRMVATVPTIMASDALRGDYSNQITVMAALQPYVYTNCYDSVPKLVTPEGRVDFGPQNTDLNDEVALSDLQVDSAPAEEGDVVAITHLKDVNTNGSIYGGHNMFDAFRTVLWKRPSSTNSSHSLLVVFYFAPNGSEWSRQLKACTIDASWIEAKTNRTSTALWNEDPGKIWGSDKPRRYIRLDPRWAQRHFTNTLATVGEYELTQSLLAPSVALALAYLPRWPNARDWVMQTTLYATNTLRSAGTSSLQSSRRDALIKFVNENKLLKKYDYIYHETFLSNWTDPAQLAQVGTFDLRTTYGYSGASTSVRLSIAVLSVYILITLAYLLHTLITGSTATSWNSLSEVLMLALNSKNAERIANTSVGVDTLETYRQPVNIRVNEINSLEIVFDSNSVHKANTYGSVVPNAKY